jgi:hypothetical protein
MNRSYNPMLWVAIVAGLFILAAGVGSFTTARHIDQSAVGVGSSTDRQSPNAIQEQQDKKSAHGPSATTTGGGSSVPPASK